MCLFLKWIYVIVGIDTYPTDKIVRNLYKYIKEFMIMLIDSNCKTGYRVVYIGYLLS